jgi:light-regulated signal transduction histidine kinase (bacteriophytochrome)
MLDNAAARAGLAICRPIIEPHGEQIWEESTPGEGSTFRVMLPLEFTVKAPTPLTTEPSKNEKLAS